MVSFNMSHDPTQTSGPIRFKNAIKYKHAFNVPMKNICNTAMKQNILCPIKLHSLATNHIKTATHILLLMGAPIAIELDTKKELSVKGS